MPYCLNCQSEINFSEKYCSICGQKTKISALSIFSIVKDFLSNLFNVENKIWRTLRDIWIPGKLSIAYIEGKRAQYYNPIRIFLIVLFTFFTVTLLTINEEIQSLNEFSDAQVENAWVEKLIIRYDSLVCNQFVFSDSLSFKEALFEENIELDSIDLTELTDESIDELDDIVDELKLTDKELIAAIKDSLLNAQTSLINIQYKSEDGKMVKQPLKINRKDGMNLSENFPASDLYSLSPEELKVKHGQGNKYYELGLGQLQKLFKDFSGSFSFLISNGTWALIATILLLALGFKLLYFRHNFLYAEHFIFHLYGHTRMLLIVLLILIISSTLGNGILTTLLYGVAFIAAPVYLYMGMKRFYGQKGIRMKLKFMTTVLFLYPFIISICMVLITMLSFLFI